MIVENLENGLGTFKLIGNPCNGPIPFPSRARYSSHALALSKASSKNISVRQFTHCCAIAALLQNAVTTSTLVAFPVVISSTNAVAS